MTSLPLSPGGPAGDVPGVLVMKSDVFVCADTCPCRQVRALGGPWPVFSTGERFELVELPAPTDYRAVLLPREKVARSRWFAWRPCA